MCSAFQNFTEAELIKMIPGWEEVSKEFSLLVGDQVDTPFGSMIPGVKGMVVLPTELKEEPVALREAYETIFPAVLPKDQMA